jgi:hypothetical protein
MVTFGEEQPNGSFAKLYKKRVANNQDLAILVSDHQNRRGTGKTVLSLKVASRLDRTEEGITKEKVSIGVDSLLDSYTKLPKGSALILDEAESGLNKYEAGTQVNKAMRELVSMGRIEEKYLILNLPSSGALDRDLKALCDWWWLVQYKGLAKGHHLQWNPYTEQPRTPKKRDLEWTDIEEGTQLRDVYNYLTKLKRKHLRGESEESSQRLTPAEVQNRIDTIKSETKTETRNRLLEEIYSNSDLTQQELASSVGLSRSRLADIVN